MFTYLEAGARQSPDIRSFCWLPLGRIILDKELGSHPECEVCCQVRGRGDCHRDSRDSEISNERTVVV